MTVLSDQDIKKELGINIYIYPFKEANLKGASYNLTASKFAWSLKEKSQIDTADGKIIIPPRDTALIETEEVIWVSEKISGTYHSRVSIVSQGIGHINTTLDPDYLGSSLIALHNNTDVSIELIVGKPFVTLTFQYVQIQASNTDRNNSPGRKDILSKLKMQIYPDADDWFNRSYMGDKNLLLDELRKCDDYKKIQDKRKEEEEEQKQQEEQQKQKKENQFSQLKFNVLLAVAVVLLITPIFFDWVSGNLKSLSNFFDTIFNKIFPSLGLIVMLIIIDDLKEKFLQK
ncbi:hypothetical protein PCC7424_0729 [Gloeothece citriformis PCC 7424]|uniref:Deoxycytidine triphosphate deaminase n=1 Tax=Gloeothece citriformis (strain PCC 7424) TaxID=65393 RepID=B7KFZ2_GLOC7|nr:hypothetical protein [Gloeothece citriformis]ACK69185.1 hypothetical protein PCC7424_0729 [Gloeothece citriformis PCC 7424]